MTEVERRAREFIDSILAINARHGHPSRPSEADYERAVRDAARPAARLVAAAREENPT